jgi:hypothetical protein
MSDMSTTSSDFGESYFNDGHLGTSEDYSWESEHWRTFFSGVAERIVGLLAPATAWDVGCAKGLLVQALAERGVDSRGSDISEYAVKGAHPDVVDRLTVHSATEPIPGRYDLVTCVEVLEHMAPEDAQRAIDVMCDATDRILFSSTPNDFGEATHVNVHPTAQWAAWFAERGFYRDVDADVTFLAPWAVLFERVELPARSIVERYERLLAPVRDEVVEKRKALLDAQRRLADATVAPRTVEARDRSVQERHAALVARDHVIGLEAQVATLQFELRRVRDRLRRTRENLKKRNEELAALRASRTWRAGRILVAPLSKFKR